jgi:hypothetical protein
MAFPTTAILDDFNRGNTGPPLSANWTADPSNVGVGGHRVVSQVATQGEHSYWSASTFGPDQEAYMTIVNMAGTVAALFMRIQSAGTSSSDFYSVDWTTGGSLSVTRCIDSFSVETTIDSASVAAVANGYKLGAEVLGTGATVTINVYIDTGSGWTLALTASDTGATRVVAAGYIGFVTTNSAATVDNFGGGTVVVGGADPEGRLVGGKLVGRGLLGGVLTAPFLRQGDAWQRLHNRLRSGMTPISVNG